MLGLNLRKITYLCKMKKEHQITFQDFLEKFPEIPLPVTLSDDSIMEFSKRNDPLSVLMIEKFIRQAEQTEPDEFTEYIACIRFPKTHDFHALIYWKGALLNYQYVLATFKSNGELIDRAVIAGTYSDGQVLTRSVATIEEDWIIYVMSGQATNDGETYDPSTSNAFNLELLATGEIITSE